LKNGIEGLWYDDPFDEFSRVSHIRGQSGKARRYLRPIREAILDPRLYGSVAGEPVDRVGRGLAILACDRIGLFAHVCRPHSVL
jgi:hypothetical protein